MCQLKRGTSPAHYIAFPDICLNAKYILKKHRAHKVSDMWRYNRFPNVYLHHRWACCFKSMTQMKDKWNKNENKAQLHNTASSYQQWNALLPCSLWLILQHFSKSLFQSVMKGPLCKMCWCSSHETIGSQRPIRIVTSNLLMVKQPLWTTKIARYALNQNCQPLLTLGSNSKQAVVSHL